MVIDQRLIAQIIASHQAVDEDDQKMVRQIERAMNQLAYEGRYVGNPMLASCAEIMLKDFNPSAIIPGCSNGANRYQIYMAPRFPACENRR